MYGRSAGASPASGDGAGGWPARRTCGQRCPPPRRKFGGRLRVGPGEPQAASSPVSPSSKRSRRRPTPLGAVRALTSGLPGQHDMDVLRMLRAGHRHPTPARCAGIPVRNGIGGQRSRQPFRFPRELQEFGQTRNAVRPRFVAPCRPAPAREASAALPALLGALFLKDGAADPRLGVSHVQSQRPDREPDPPDRRSGR